MQIILNHNRVRVHKLAKPIDRKGERVEIAVSLPEASFEITRERAEVLASMLALALDATEQVPAAPAPLPVSGELVFLRRQAD